MPREVVLLMREPEPISICHACGASPFEAFLRGQVQRSRRRFLLFGRARPHCAIICRECKEIVGYEDPWTGELELV